MSRTIFTVHIPLFVIAFVFGGWCATSKECLNRYFSVPEIAGDWEYDYNESMWQHYLVNFLEDGEPRINREEFFQKLDPSKRVDVTMRFQDDFSYQLVAADTDFPECKWRVTSQNGRSATIEFFTENTVLEQKLLLTFINQNSFYTTLPGKGFIEVFCRVTK